MERSATTKELQQKEYQAFAEQAVSVVKPARAPAAILLDLPGQTQAYTQAAVTEVDVPNEDAQLLPGAFVQVHLSTGGSRQSLMIPANTLLFRSEGTMVGVVGADNKVEVRKIKIGKDLGTNMEV